MTGFPDWALEWLRCPHCGGALSDCPDDLPGGPSGGDETHGVDPGPGHRAVVGCGAGHRFDVARQGYLPLLGSRARTDTGDDARMVAARQDFLAGGWYAPIADAVREAVRGLPGRPGLGSRGPIVEIGAGTGYYLTAACAEASLKTHDEAAADAVCAGAPHGDRARRRGLAIDASRYALRRAARLPDVAAVLADAWSPLPVRDGIAGAALSVFAPRDPAELTRVTVSGGRIVIVTPETDHLAELRGPLPLLAVDAGKAERVLAAFAGHPVAAVDAWPVRFGVRLPRAAVTALVAMGPTARHLDATSLELAASVLPEPIRVTVSVTVTALQRDGSATF